MSSQPLQWQCISQCGACCRLAPEERPEALEALNDEDQATYLAMVGKDGWCIHYDSGGRRCRIYDERPRFCRVRNMDQLFGVEPDQKCGGQTTILAKEDDVEESDGGGGEYVSPAPEIACRDNMRGFILPLFGVNKFNSGSAGN